MTIRKTTRGSGLTARDMVSIEADHRGRISSENMRALKPILKDMARHNDVEAVVASHENDAEAILAKKGLPTEGERRYAIDALGNWKKVTDDFELPAPGGGWGMNVSQIVERLGYEHDTPEGRAARVIVTIARLRKAMQRGDIKEVLDEGMQLEDIVNESTIKALEPLVQGGMNSKRPNAGAKGKANRDVELPAKFDAMRADSKYDHLSDEALAGIIGKTFGIKTAKGAKKAIDRGRKIKGPKLN